MRRTQEEVERGRATEEEQKIRKEITKKRKRRIKRDTEM